MTSWRAAELAAALGADLLGNAESQIGPEVVIDSRQVTPGALFVALPGENVDGHDFVAAAFAQGAAAALVSREPPGRLSAQTVLVVPDPVRALAELARLAIRAAPAQMIIIGITGSSGKTSTKDLLSYILRFARGDERVVAPVGSFNNELGAPLTALRCRPETEYLIMEMGARQVGHIAYLATITPPQVAVVLNIGTAHLGEFGSVQRIARAKSELITAVPAGSGYAVLNADDPEVAKMAQLTEANVSWFSVARDPGGRGAWASNISQTQNGFTKFLLHCRSLGETVATAAVTLQLVGRHQVANAVAAASAALAVGIDARQIASALGQIQQISRWRMEPTVLPGGALLLNDAYNANPESMAAAIDTLAELVAARPGGKSLAILGEMLELGGESAAAHREIGRRVAQRGITQLITVGEGAAEIAAGARSFRPPGQESDSVTAVASLEEVGPTVARLGLGASTVILVKASRGVGLERVVAQIADLCPLAFSQDEQP